MRILKKESWIFSCCLSSHDKTIFSASSCWNKGCVYLDSFEENHFDQSELSETGKTTKLSKKPKQTEPSQSQSQSIENGDRVWCSAFSQDDQNVLCGTSSGFLIIFSAQDLRILAKIPAHEKGIRSCSYGKNDTLILSCSIWGKKKKRSLKNFLG